MNEEPEKNKKILDEDRNPENKPREAAGEAAGEETGEAPKQESASESQPVPESQPDKSPEASRDEEKLKKSEAELRDEHGHRYLSPEAVNAWRISGALGSLVYWLIPLGYGALSMGGDMWPEWPAYVLGALFLSWTLLEGTVLPWIRWKRWRYHVDRNEIDLRRGLFVVTRTLIPIKRVQHVDTRQGPVYRQFGLASVTVTTAGDMHEIPALSEPVADDLRTRISEYARIAREDL
ncbi:MAG: PH domain-containing protein, partial [Bacteroidota bacterium]